MDQVAIVTGGSGGLGAEICYQYALDGAKVVVNYHRSEQDAKAALERIKQAGGDGIVFKADCRDLEQVTQMANEAIKRWGRIDVLVNNAGALPVNTEFRSGTTREGSLIIDMPVDEWDWLVDTNLKAPFICIKAVAPQMIKQRSGHIVNVGSSHGLTGGIGRCGYAAGKAGLIGLSKTAARELGEHNIKVNTVLPGPIRHRRIEHFMRPGVSESGVLRRGQTAEEFAKFIVVLTKTENVSAQLFNMDNRILY